MRCLNISCQISAILLLIFAGTLTASSREPVKCPSVPTVKSGAKAIDVVEPYENRPLVYTARSSKTAFRDSNLNWKINVNPFYAKSKNEAILYAQEQVNRIAYRFSETAYESTDSYSCSYMASSTNIISVTAKKK